MKKKMSMMTLLFIPLGVAINIVTGQVTTSLALPIFLDTVGTILVAMTSGPLAGVLTGTLTNVVKGALSRPVALYFIPVSAVIGLIAGIAAKKGWLKNWRWTLFTGVLLSLGGVAVSVPITVFFFGGADGSGSSVVTGAFLAVGQTLWSSVFSSKLITETADKVLCLVIAVLISRSIPNSTLVKFPLGQKLIRNK